MKRKMICMGLSLALILGTMSTAMAAEANTETASSPVTFAVTKAPGADVQDIEGLFVSIYEAAAEKDMESGAQKMKGYCGTVDEEAMEKLLAALNLPEEEAFALQAKYEKALNIQEQVSALCDKLDQGANGGEEQLLAEIDELYKQKEQIFTGKILEKALELEILNEITIGIISDVKLDGNTVNADGEGSYVSYTFTTVK